MKCQQRKQKEKEENVLNKANLGCVPFNQSKSGFCNQKSDFPFHLEQTYLRLQSERSTSEGGSFSLVSKSGFRLCVPSSELVSDQKSPQTNRYRLLYFILHVK